MRKHQWYSSRMLICSYIATLQGPFYFIKTNRILKRRYKLLKEQYSEIESRKLEWFHIINYSFALVFIIGGVSALVKNAYLDPYVLYMAYHGVIALSIFYITLMIYKYPKLFSRPEPVPVIYMDTSVVENRSRNISLSNKEPRSEKNERVKGNDIIAKIERLMSEQKPYKNPNLSLNDLAVAISESRNDVSYVLNNSLNKTFYNYINELRIAESKQLLADQTLHHFTIEGIAAESGFKSMSVFYRFFKDLEGVTPAVYRKTSINY